MCHYVALEFHDPWPWRAHRRRTWARHMSVHVSTYRAGLNLVRRFLQAFRTPVSVSVSESTTCWHARRQNDPSKAPSGDSLSFDSVYLLQKV
eukprot:scaffold421612_cov51-Attheya_sp.AAC.1